MKWDAQTYDAKHSFVTKYGNDLVELLEPKPGERVLDIGCGTGHLTKAIADSGAVAVGLDESDSMLAIARESYPEIEFLQADASNFGVDEPFDAIFSNAALHWILDVEGAAKCMALALKPGGRFVIEMGGRGNIDQVMAALLAAVRSLGFDVDRPRKFYPSVGEYATILERHGIWPKTVWHYARPTPLEGESGLRDWYAQFGKVILDQVPDDAWPDAIRLAEDALRPTLFVEGVWYADYKRLRIIAERA